MSTAAEKILQEALALPDEERAAVRDALDSSLQPDTELGPAWKAEIARRIAAVEQGDSRLIPGDEVTSRIRSTLDDL